MGKRHQATRRKAYGRRLHELHEREQRQPGRDVFDDVLEAIGWDADATTGSGGLDLAAGRLRFATPD
jgi:hypothetical protein